MDCPIKGSKEYEKVLRKGCDAIIGEAGDYDCGHGYEWECDYCPCIIEMYREEKERYTNE